MRTRARKKAASYPLAALFLLLGLLVLAANIQPVAAEESQGWFRQWAGYADACMSVSAADADTAWAVGHNWSASYDDFIIKTEDGGENWEVDTFQSLSLIDVLALDQDTAWVVGYDSSQSMAAILKTSDGGETWQSQTSGTDMFLSGIAALDEQRAWAVGYTGTSQEGSIIKTTDGGETWIEQPPGMGLNLYDVAAVDENNVWAVGEGEDYRGIILKTNDGGDNWMVQSSGTFKDVRSIAALDASTAWAVGLSGTVIMTTDGGETWIEQELHNNSHLFDIVALDSDILWAAGRDFVIGDQIGVIYKSFDGGATWKLQSPSGNIKSLNGISAVDSSIAWTVGDYGLILHTTDGGGEPLPYAWSVEPDSGFAGDEVTITGSDFGPEQGTSQVKFGDSSATEYVSWSDSAIVCRVPTVPPEQVAVTVVTDRGESLELDFQGRAPAPTIDSVFLNFGFTNTWSTIHVWGSSYWADNTVVWLVDEDTQTVILPYEVTVESSNHIICTFSLGGAPGGKYDVMVRNEDGGEGMLEDGYTVIDICGQGGGTALLAFGLTMGLFSFAGFSRLRKRRRK